MQTTITCPGNWLKQGVWLGTFPPPSDMYWFPACSSFDLELGCYALPDIAGPDSVPGGNIPVQQVLVIWPLGLQVQPLILRFLEFILQFSDFGPKTSGIGGTVDLIWLEMFLAYFKTPSSQDTQMYCRAKIDFCSTFGWVSPVRFPLSGTLTSHGVLYASEISTSSGTQTLDINTSVAFKYSTLWCARTVSLQDTVHTICCSCC